MKPSILSFAFICCAALLLAAPREASPQSQTFKGLQFTVSAVDRTTEKVNLTDCPPGSNTVNGVLRSGEEFMVVKVDFKVLPAFKPVPIKRPTVTDEAGTIYNTAVSFVDVGKVPEFSCNFPFRVPAGTKLRKFQIETMSVDLSKLPSPTTP